MGMNYYHVTKIAGGVVEKRHIGKSSYGWMFGLRVYPDDGLESFLDWLIRLKDGAIVDEGGEAIPYHKFLEKFRTRDISLRRLAVGEEGCIEHGENWDLIEGDFC